MIFGDETAENYYDEGLTASMKGDLETAVRHFERAIQLDHHLSTAKHQLGKCYLRMGEGEKAAVLLKEVASRYPEQIPARIELGYALLEIQKAWEAVKVFEAVLAERPENSRATLGLAYCAFERGEWASAALLAQQSVTTGGANFATLFLLGRAAKLAGWPDYPDILKRAGTLIEKTIETSPDQPEGYYLRGELHFVKENFPKALDCFRQAEDRAEKGKHYAAFNAHFKRVDVIVKRGLCLQRLGEDDGARKAGEEALFLDPNHPIAQRLAGQGGS